ncbi:hypothetical protein BZA70DRAFT_308166 [Myxozyma melibiosi]|uniref:RRM domain-containing protein n=1 Tax=Myxozyma melibiosi TaxID=54550 RepID=A0ABR1FBS1_9ASCO
MSSDQATEAPSVGDVSATLEATSVSDPSAEAQPVEAAGVDESESSPTNEVPPEITEKRRLYIGNLPSGISEDDVKGIFGDYSISAVTVRPSKYVALNSSYAFIDLVSADDAEAAVAAKNDSDYNERKLYVQLARPPRPRRQFRRGDIRSRAPRSTRRNGRGNRGAAQEAGGSPVDGEAPAEGAVEASGSTESQNDENASPAKKTRAKPKRAAKPRRAPREGPPSTDTVYVANLSYTCTKEHLEEFFQPYQPEQVRVALRYLPPFLIRKLTAKGTMVPPRSLGHAFVKLPSEELQKKAIAELDGKELQGRSISVRVAIEPEKKTDASGEEKADEAEPSASASAETAESAPAPAPEIEASA